MLNYLNRLIQYSFLELSINNFGDVRQFKVSLAVNSIEPGQIAWMNRLAWFYTGGKC